MTVHVAIACNNASGHFTGQFDCAEFTSDDEFDCMVDGEPLDLHIEGDSLFISDLDTRFRFTKLANHEGNFCWDSFDMIESEARRLFQLLIAKKWTVTEYVHGGMFEDLVEEAW
jgi:hypothetical protein